MKTFPLTRSLSAEEYKRVRSLMSRLRQGSENILRSPLFSGQSAEEIASGWRKASKSLPTLDPKLMEIEGEQESKFGARSIALPYRDFRDSVYAYWNDPGGRDLDPGHLEKGRANPHTVARTVKSMKLDTSSGLPLMKRKSLALDQTLRMLRSAGVPLSTNPAEVGDLSAPALNKPAILNVRTQEQKKTRPIWMWAFASTILEQCYAQPLIQEEKTWKWRTALVGPDAVDQAVTNLFKRARIDRLDKRESLLSIDFSQFDASLQPRLLRPALDRLLQRFQSSPLLDHVKDRVLDVGLVTPDGVITGEHGMSSGSSLTNSADSMVQFMIAETFLGNSTATYNSQIQGDDGLYLTNKPEELMARFEDYGLAVNTSKSHVSKEYAVYLQRYYSWSYYSERARGLGGVYPTFRALNRIVFPERWPDAVEADSALLGGNYFAIRTISILENAKYHPWFRALVAYVARNDRNQLRYSEEALQEYKAKFQRLGTPGTQNQLGEQLAGFESFDTVKVLKEIWKG